MRRSKPEKGKGDFKYRECKGPKAELSLEHLITDNEDNYYDRCMISTDRDVDRSQIT